MEDWRLSRGQEDYLSGVVFHKERMLPQPQDLGFHKHCELCWTTLSPYGTDEHEGYVSENRQYWLCQSCFQEFKNILSCLYQDLAFW